MTAPRDLFSFSQKETKDALKASKLHKKIPGLKLLRASDPSLLHGKLLIVIPRAFGKAHDRNLLRRRARSIYYEEKLYSQPFVWILICYSEAQNLSFEQLKTFLIENITDAS